MAILTTFNEGSEESRQKRAVRRYLNKKKERKDLDETVVQTNEAMMIPGSMGHMMYAVHEHHVNNQTSPHYHIHHIATINPPSDGTGPTHRYLVVHKDPHQTLNGHAHHVSTFNLWNEDGKTHVTHNQHIE